MRLHSPPQPNSAIMSVGGGAEPLCPKFHAVQRWAARRLGGVRHERQVAAIASSLFDLTRPLHKLSLADRRLLRLGAIVHDVGRCVCKAEHPKEGARLHPRRPTRCRSRPPSAARSPTSRCTTAAPCPPPDATPILQPLGRSRPAAARAGAAPRRRRAGQPLAGGLRAVVFALTPRAARNVRCATCYLSAPTQQGLQGLPPPQEVPPAGRAAGRQRRRRDRSRRGACGSLPDASLLLHLSLRRRAQRRLYPRGRT